MSLKCELFRYERIQRYQTSIFISHEHDPAWRQAIIANTPSLLALRHMYDESQDDYKIIMLNKMHLNMRFNLIFKNFLTVSFLESSSWTESVYVPFGRDSNKS